jgi:hypothetical protein
MPAGWRRLVGTRIARALRKDSRAFRQGELAHTAPGITDFGPVRRDCVSTDWSNR